MHLAEQYILMVGGFFWRKGGGVMSEECFIALPSKYVIWNMWYVIADQYI